MQHLSAAGPEKETWKEIKAELRAEGWKQVSDKVFERQRTDTKIERLAYGREGLVWMIGELKGQDYHDVTVYTEPMCGEFIC